MSKRDTAPHAYGADEAEAIAQELGLDLETTDRNLAKLARIMDIVRRDTARELAEELEGFGHTDAAETLRANGMA